MRSVQASYLEYKVKLLPQQHLVHVKGDQSLGLHICNAFAILFRRTLLGSAYLTLNKVNDTIFSIKIISQHVTSVFKGFEANFEEQAGI